MITTTCQDFVKTYPKDALFSNGKHDTLDSRNQKALGVRAILRCYDSDSSASHHSKTQPLTQGFAMTKKIISTTSHTFNVEYADLYDIECAIMIKSFYLLD